MKKNEQVGFQILFVGCGHCIKEGGGLYLLYKEPLKSSKNVVIVNNGTYGPDHNSHSMIYGNPPTGSLICCI